MLADSFVDPTLRIASGLQDGRCDDCGARALVDADYCGAVRCGRCWRHLRHAPPVTRSHLRDIGWPASEPSRQRRPPGQPLAPAAPAYRVLTLARAAERHEIPYAASALAALCERNGRVATLTHALAEETASGQLVRSLAVRIDDAACRRTAYAVWHDDRFRSAVWLPTLRRMSLAELSATLAGQAYTPPERRAAPTGPCPRCWRVVRWTRAGTTYAHRDLHTKLPCIP